MQKPRLEGRGFLRRGGRDSNPRLSFKSQHSLSRRAQSASLAPPQVHLHFPEVGKAEGEGFEPPVTLRPRLISSQLP